MRTLLLIFVTGLFLVGPREASAQQWTSEQQEVWEFESRCWQYWADKDFEGRKSCFHEDYRGWFSDSPVPRPYNEVLDKREFDLSKWVGFDLMPHRISVYGNMAVVQYTGMVVVEGLDGNDTTIWVHWTDIAMKEDGRWSWIADHGHRLPSN